MDEPTLSQQVKGLGKRDSEAARIAHILEDLQDQVEEPTFHRCFLVVGEMGSGKSHFLASLVARIDVEQSNEFSLVLPLEPPFGQETLSDLVDQGIRDATQMGWRGVVEFDRFLESANSEEGSYQPGPRFIIAIDDLQRWLYARPNFQEELIRYVEDHSQHRRVHWLVLLQSTDYDRVCGGDTGAFWHRYGCISRRSWVNAMSGRKSRSSDFLPEVAEDWPFKGSWLDLDRFNENEKIGHDILRAKLDEGGRAIVLGVRNIDQELTPTSLWANPFIAWALLEFRDVLPLESLVDLSFVEFVTRFWEKRRTVLQANLAELLKNPILRTELLLNQAVDLIARYLVESGDLAPRLTQLLNAIVAAARDESELQQRALAERTIQVLEQGRLLESSVEKQVGGGLSEVERVHIGIEPFWNLHFADHLRMRAPLVNFQHAETQLELETWFGTVTAESIHEGVLEFLLLRADQDAVTIGDFNAYLWQLALEEPTLPRAAAWFAGAKASAQIRNLLVDWAAKHPNEIDNRRSLFALMYFVGEACADIETAKALSLLKAHYSAIHDAGLVDYFLFIANRLFEHEDENAAIRASLPYLSGCEVMQVTEELAAITMAALARNANVSHEPESGLPTLLDLMVDYLRKSQAQAKREYEARPERISWHRTFFREWLLFSFCHLCTRHKKLEAFALLYNQHWFDPKELDIDHPVALEMEREANIALGGEFYWRSQAFLDLAINLAASPDPHDRELAFHLIRHTVTTKGQIVVVLDDCFRPLLGQLFLDTGLQRTVHRFYGVFEANLTNSAGLLTQQQLIAVDRSTALRVLAAFADQRVENMPEEAHAVPDTCGRIPLALSLIGGAARNGMAWSDLVDALHQVVLTSLSQAMSKPSDAFVWKAMQVSMNALHQRDPETASRCIELIVFPPDTAVPESTVLLLWQKSGGMDEGAARQLLTTLEHRALVRVDGRRA